MREVRCWDGRELVAKKNGSYQVVAGSGQIAILPSEDVFFKRLLLPIDDRSKVEQAMRYQLDDITPFKDSGVTRYSVSIKDGESTVILYSAHRESVKAYDSYDAVIPAPHALLWYAREMDVQNCLIHHIEEHYSYFALIIDGELCHCNTLKVGVRDFDGDVDMLLDTLNKHSKRCLSLTDRDLPILRSGIVTQAEDHLEGDRIEGFSHHALAVGALVSMEREDVINMCDPSKKVGSIWRVTLLGISMVGISSLVYGSYKSFELVERHNTVTDRPISSVEEIYVNSHHLEKRPLMDLIIKIVSMEAYLESLEYRDGVLMVKSTQAELLQNELGGEIKEIDGEVLLCIKVS